MDHVPVLVRLNCDLVPIELPDATVRRHTLEELRRPLYGVHIKLGIQRIAQIPQTPELLQQ